MSPNSGVWISAGSFGPLRSLLAECDTVRVSRKQQGTCNLKVEQATRLRVGFKRQRYLTPTPRAVHRGCAFLLWTTSTLALKISKRYTRDSYDLSSAIVLRGLRRCSPRSQSRPCWKSFSTFRYRQSRHCPRCPNHGPRSWPRMNNQYISGSRSGTAIHQKVMQTPMLLQEDGKLGVSVPPDSLFGAQQQSFSHSQIPD